MYRSLYHKEAKALMLSNSYLKNRNGNYSLRFRIPSDLSPLIPKAEIVKSLKTSNLKTAKVSALPYVQGITQTLALLRSEFITAEQATERLMSLIGKKPIERHKELLKERLKSNMEPEVTYSKTAKLSSFIKTYTKDKGHGWTAKSKMEMEGIFKLLVGLIGDVPVKSISRDTVRTLRDNLQKLPANVSKLYPKLSPLEVIRQIDSGELTPSPTLSISSVNSRDTI